MEDVIKIFIGNTLYDFHITGIETTRTMFSPNTEFTIRGIGIPIDSDPDSFQDIKSDLPNGARLLLEHKEDS